MKLSPTPLAFCLVLGVSCNAVEWPSEQRAMYGHSRPEGFASSPSHSDALFSASDGEHGIELWRFDGTEAHLVQDINRGFLGWEKRRSSHPGDITRIAESDRAFFTARSYNHGRELWHFDGKTANLVQDIRRGQPSSNPHALGMFGGLVLFSANDGEHGRELWSSDGTQTKMIEIAQGKAGSSPSGFTEFNGRAYFSATDEQGANKLRWFDGVNHGVVDVGGATSPSPQHLTVWGEQLWFSARTDASGRDLMRYDGTTVTPVEIAAGDKSSTPGRPAAGESHLALTARDADGKRQLYLVDADGEIRKVTDFARGFTIRSVTWAGDDLFFVVDGKAGDAGTTADSGLELWRLAPGSDTPELFDIRPGAAGSKPMFLTAFTGGLLFNADDRVIGREPWVWKRGGTSPNPRPLHDIKTGDSAQLQLQSSSPSRFSPVGATRFVFAANNDSGRELWETDGATAWQVADIDSDTPPLPLLKVKVSEGGGLGTEMRIEGARSRVTFLVLVSEKLKQPVTNENMRGAIVVKEPWTEILGPQTNDDGAALILLAPLPPRAGPGLHELGIQGFTFGSETVATPQMFCTWGSCTANDGGNTATVEVPEFFGCVNDQEGTWQLMMNYTTGTVPVHLRLVQFTPDSPGSNTGERVFITDPESLGDLPTDLDVGEMGVEAMGGPVNFELPLYPGDPNGSQIELWIFINDPVQPGSDPDLPPPGSCRVWKSYC